MREGQQRRIPSVLIVVFLIMWVFWCAIFAYLTYYIPSWQEAQAQRLQEAIDRDCAIAFDVKPASIRISNRPFWREIYPRTGKEIECSAVSDQQGWVCTRCGDGP